ATTPLNHGTAPGIAPRSRRSVDGLAMRSWHRPVMPSRQALFERSGDHPHFAASYLRDRPTAVVAPDELIGLVKRPRWSRLRKGGGLSIEHKREWLERIAFRPPSTI